MKCNYNTNNIFLSHINTRYVRKYYIRYSAYIHIVYVTKNVFITIDLSVKINTRVMNSKYINIYTTKHVCTGLKTRIKGPS